MADMGQEKHMAEERQVQVKFSTQLPATLRVPTTSFSVPASLTRYGLSEVVNTLLGLEKVQPFDFLVGGELLRTSLEKALLKQHISAETVVNVEYILAVTPPQPGTTATHPDWVSAVDASISGCVLTGSYDAVARLWVGGERCGCTLAGHTDPITALLALPTDSPSGAGAQEVVTASKDRSLRLWQIPATAMAVSTGQHPVTVGASRVFRGHKASVQSLASSPSGVELCSGAWDGSILLWSTTGEGEEEDPVVSKKQRVGGKAAATAGVSQVPPRAQLEGHTGCVSALSWQSPSEVWSGSWDHSLRSWDVATSVNVQTLTGTKAVHCMTTRPGAIAAGGSDPVVRIWDPRAASITPVQLLSSHSAWISALKWCPGKEEQLLSASHDGSLKVWDLRSVVPLHTVEAHTDKVLCADWSGQMSVVSGGADSQLRTFSYNERVKS